MRVMVELSVSLSWDSSRRRWIHQSRHRCCNNHSVTVCVERRINDETKISLRVVLDGVTCGWSYSHMRRSRARV